MQYTPVRRLAAGATATAILAGAFLIPAAIAAADELVETPVVVVDAAAGEELVDTAPAEQPAEEQPAEEQPAVEPQPGDAGETPDDPAVPAEAPAPPQLAPTAASTDDPQDPDGAIAPGATLEVPYVVTGAKIVYLYAIGADLDVWVVRADGYRLPLQSNGVNHSAEHYWLGNVDGTWTLQITNTGTAPITPEYGLTYSTPNGSLEPISSVYAPALSIAVTPVIDGRTRTDLVVHSEITAADGTVHSQALLPVVTGSTQYQTSYTGLANGRYLTRVWTVVDGVTYQATRTVGVHAAETEPPTVAVSTSPTAPNADGWFRRVLFSFTGSDSGSGYAYTRYTIDGGPEKTVGTGISVPLDSDGEHIVRFRGQDNQGNLSDWAETTIRVDATAPVIALYGIAEGARYAVGEEVFVEFQCGDATSGLVGDDCVADRPDGARIDTTTPGDYTFTISATDLAGNTTRIVRTYSVVAPDTTDPEIEVDVPAVPASGWYLDTVTVRLAASDESGIRRIHYEYDTSQGTVSRDVEADTAEVTFDRSQYSTLSYWAEDNAGNRSEGRDLQLYVDATAPWVNLVSPADEPSILPNGHYAQHERVVVDFSCDDDASGVASCEGTTPDGELLPTNTPGTHELRIVVTDVAGHRTERVVSYTVDAAPAPGGAGGTPGTGAAGGLASTGLQDVVPALVIATLLLGAGGALMIRRRVRTR